MDEAKRFIESLKFVNTKIAKGLGRDRALLYTLFVLQEQKIEALFPEICVASCKLFPLFFSLKGEFSEYPDGRKVRDAIWHLEDEKKCWIRGGMKSGYIPTEKGKDIYKEEVIPLLKGELQKPQIYSTGSDKPEYFIRRCVETDIFRKFLAGEKDGIKEYEARYLLRGTRTTNIRILHDNLYKLIKYYKSLSFDDITADPKTKRAISKKEWDTLGEMLEYIKQNFDKIIPKK